MVYECIGANSIEWTANTYQDIQDIAGEAGSIIVVPVGSIEQHGPHLPTSTDTILATAVAEESAQTATEENDVPVLVLPPVWTGHSHHHLPFGGTASAEIDTLRSILFDVANTTLQNGFDVFVMVNGHGGNRATITNATAEIGQHQPEVEVMGLSYFTLAGDTVSEHRESDHGGMRHGGELETSLMLYLRPELVDEDNIRGTYGGKPYELESQDLFDSGPLSVYRDFDAYTEEGAAGSPELATKDKGEQFFAAYREEFTEFLTTAHRDKA